MHRGFGAYERENVDVVSMVVSFDIEEQGYRSHYLKNTDVAVIDQLIRGKRVRSPFRATFLVTLRFRSRLVEVCRVFLLWVKRTQSASACQVT